MKGIDAHQARSDSDSSTDLKGVAMLEILNFDDDDPPVFSVRITGERSSDGLDAWLAGEMPGYVQGKENPPWVQILADDADVVSYDDAAKLARDHDVVLSLRIEGTGTATFSPEA